jgi:hypothetical protein
MTRRALVPVLLAAALASAPAAHAHDQGSFAYYKWHQYGTFWVLRPAAGCTAPCAAHGYEHDDNGPIAGHQYGESWDCKYQVFVLRPPSGYDPGVDTSPVYQALNDASDAAWAALDAEVTWPEIPAFNFNEPPPCPGDGEFGDPDVWRTYITTGIHFP